MTGGQLRRTAIGFVGVGIALVWVGCRAAPQPKPLSQLTAEESRGHVIYRAQCAACHYDRQNGVLHGPSLASLYKKPQLPSGAAATDERVAATILHGRGNMPAMGRRIDDEELQALLAYLHTL